MEKRRIAVILGGRSGEHEVSLTSARNIISALDRDHWEPVPIGITRQGNWLTSSETCQSLARGLRSFDSGGEPLLTAAALGDLADCDAAFPIVHGTFGEDGTLQGLLEMAGLPYAGAGVAASAIGMDKALMKALFAEAGIPVTPFGVIRSWEYADAQNVVSFAEQTVGYPCFVKPANGGSSVGVTRVRSREDLPAAFAAAFAYDDKIVVERAVVGQEVEVSVLGNERPEASIVGEIAPDREFYDYDSKYASDSTTTLHIPARISAATAERVREMAVRMYQAMGCEGYARVDFFVVNGENVIANEVNTIPGFTNISMYPKLWEASGIGYTALLSRILGLAFERHQRRRRR
jgi:D-alanine-D-alanine ligase